MNHRSRREFKMNQGIVPNANGNLRIQGGTNNNDRRVIFSNVVETSSLHSNAHTPNNTTEFKSELLLSVSKVIKEELGKLDVNFEDKVTDILESKMEEIIGTVMHFARKELEETRLHINLVETTINETHAKEIEALHKEITNLKSQQRPKSTSPLEKKEGTGFIKNKDLQSRERIKTFLEEQLALRHKKRTYVDIPEGYITGFKTFLNAKGRVWNDSDVFFLHLGNNGGGYTIVGNLRYIMMVFFVICKYENSDEIITEKDLMKAYKVDVPLFYQLFSTSDFNKIGAFYLGTSEEKDDRIIRDFIDKTIVNNYLN